MPHFSIIIVSWNALHHLQEFLPSVVNSNYESFEIILADNASEDGSKQWVKQMYPGVKIASFDQNYGYCGGNNRAVPYAEGEILIFLNNDVKVDSDWLSALNNYFDTHDHVAAIQPKLRSYQEPEFFEYAGAAGGFIDKYGYPFCRGRIFDVVEKDEQQYDKASPIFWASGAALAIKKSVFEELGGFDEDFEFHMEEIDLCWRLWNHGHEVHYCPDSVVYHLGGGSLPMNSPRKTYYNYRNNLKMLWKNYESGSLIWRFLLRLKLDGIAACKELVSGNTKNFGAIFKAHIHFYKSWRKTHVKRKKLQDSRTVYSNPKTMFQDSVVWQFFVSGKKTFSELKRE
ncbi:MAG: glycosyltransferase family 2 protein [Balneolaceae bacterium]|nr:glycosyltransferase family 2 protein [Balneolaceae bacterium]